MTGDTLCDQSKPIALGGRRLPRSVVFGLGPSQDQDRPRQDGAGAATAGRGRPDAADLPRSEYWRDDPLRTRRAARRQIALDRMTRKFGVNVELGTAARALPRDDLGQDDRRVQAQEADRRRRASTVTSSSSSSRCRTLSSSSPKGLRRHRCQGTSSRRSRRASARRCEAGPVAGYPVVNVRVTLTDGSYHAVDSNEMAFKIASNAGLQERRLAGRSRSCWSRS